MLLNDQLACYKIFKTVFISLYLKIKCLRKLKKKKKPMKNWTTALWLDFDYTVESCILIPLFNNYQRMSSIPLYIKWNQ